MSGTLAERIGWALAREDLDIDLARDLLEEAGPALEERPVTFSLGEVRDGTGWPADVRFVVVTEGGVQRGVPQLYPRTVEDLVERLANTIAGLRDQLGFR